MKILCVGGGSGGHITPIVAVIKEIEAREPDVEARVWCDRKFGQQAKNLLAGAGEEEVRVSIIPAGKLRRYANLPWWYRWFSPYHIIHTHIPNLIDLFKIAGGFVASLVKLLVWRPDVVFCKGGYVCLPVGIVAHLYKIPLVIHDSDTVPGLTNRVLARFATAIGTGAPVENYPSYPKSKTKFVGIPVRDEIKPASVRERNALKKKLGFSVRRPLIMAMGGGLGAAEINAAVAQNAAKLIDKGADILLLCGRGRSVALDLTDEQLDHIQVQEFSTEIADSMRACDLMITRAGATTMAELAAIKVPTIIIPSPYLAGDHQTKNAMVYQKAGAAIVINQFKLEKQPALLSQAINRILSDPAKAKQMAQNLGKFARPNALKDMADLILGAAVR